MNTILDRKKIPPPKRGKVVPRRKGLKSPKIKKSWTEIRDKGSSPFSDIFKNVLIEILGMSRRIKRQIVMEVLDTLPLFKEKKCL